MTYTIIADIKKEIGFSLDKTLSSFNIAVYQTDCPFSILLLLYGGEDRAERDYATNATP